VKNSVYEQQNSSADIIRRIVMYYKTLYCPP
jgi:hypothetical protein